MPKALLRASLDAVFLAPKQPRQREALQVPGGLAGGARLLLGLTLHQEPPEVEGG